MQLVPLSTYGRVTAVTTTVTTPGPLRVVLEPHATGVDVVATGAAPRPVGRLETDDAAAYGPVLARLAADGARGTCAARVTATGALVLDLGPAADCLPATSSCSPPSGP